MLHMTDVGNKSLLLSALAAALDVTDLSRERNS